MQEKNLILSSGSFFDNLSNKKPHIAVGGKSVRTLFLSLESFFQAYSPQS
nr:MAG TPA: hypothetical protein [Bacteriophage sp.]